MIVKSKRHVKPTIPIQAFTFPKTPPRNMIREIQIAATPLKNKGIKEPAVKSSPRDKVASPADIRAVRWISVVASEYLFERTNSGIAALLEIYIDMAVRKMKMVKPAPRACLSKCAPNKAKYTGSIAII